MNQLPFLVSLQEEDDSETKGLFKPDAETVLRMVPVEQLRQNLRNSCESLLEILSEIKSIGNFRLREITLQVEVTANGGVNFIGTAALGGKGAITLKFSE